MLLSFALRSVRSRPRSWIVGLLAAGMATLLTLGVAFVESIHGGTRRSLIESRTGDLQVYNAAATEPPQMVLTGNGGAAPLPPLPDYPALEKLLRSVEGVQEVVPLEMGLGTVFRGNYLDDKLAAVRDVAREPASPEREARLGRLAEDLARTLQRVARDAKRREEAFASDAQSREDQRALEVATSEDFWARFRADPLPALEFLDNQVARQVGEGETLFLDLLGTDLPRFARAFPRFELVSGQLPPAGQRGILLGHAAYEEYFKLPIAFRLDGLKREHDRGATFAVDERLRTEVERNLAGIPALVARLDVDRASALRATLVRLLGHEGELEALLTEFLQLTDDNFDERYQRFYSELVPHLPLYRLRPGDTLPLKNDLAVPVKVWGTYRFRGLGGDTSLVNTLCLVDLVTSRHLSGRQTRAQQEEARRLIESFGMSGSAEDLSLGSFGRPQIVEAEGEGSTSEAEPVVERAQGPAPGFSEEELLSGSVLQAALVLKPEVSSEAVAERIGQLAAEKKLPVKTATWQEVGGLLSGVVGMTQVLLLVLGALLGFFVLLVSAGTLLLLARERVGEVGTMRAVGMQRWEVFAGLLLEGLLLGVVGSAVGIGLGAALLAGLAGEGLAVRDEMLQFFLGGPVMYLRLEAGHALAVGLGVVAVVVGAALVPAWRGSAVAPITAMRRGED